jgi:transcriptional regulator GlxA family with amidase domain
MDLRQRVGVSHPKLLAAIGAIEAHLDEPLSRKDLARDVGLSIRQLERLFRVYMGKTPTRYYLEARLAHARSLLAQTSMSILEVALASGFASASHFAKSYRALFGHSPRAERHRAAPGGQAGTAPAAEPPDRDADRADVAGDHQA